MKQGQEPRMPSPNQPQERQRGAQTLITQCQNKGNIRQMPEIHDIAHLPMMHCIPMIRDQYPKSPITPQNTK